MAKLPTPRQVLDKTFKANEWHIPKAARNRYFDMLALRALRFYIDGQLDPHVIDEDLADCKSDTGYYESGKPLTKTDLGNLKYSEENEAAYYKNI